MCHRSPVLLETFLHITESVHEERVKLRVSVVGLGSVLLAHSPVLKLQLFAFVSRHAFSEVLFGLL